MYWSPSALVRFRLHPAAHDFIFGDVMDWLKRFQRKGRLFDQALREYTQLKQALGQPTLALEKLLDATLGASLNRPQPAATT